jgi:hypothetical protein
MFASLQVYKFAKLKINNHKFTIWLIENACLQVCKITKSPNYKFQNTKLQKKLFINYMWTFINFKLINLKASQFKIIIKTKFASTCLQICKTTKLPKLQILEVHFCIFTSKCMCSFFMFSNFHVLKTFKIINI